MTYDRVRIYDQIRTVHLERSRVLAPASIIYKSRRYDYDPSLATDLDLLQLKLVPMVVTLARSRVRAMEISEPLLLTGILRAAAAVAVGRAAARLRNRRLTVVSYAIENFDTVTVPERRRRSAVRRRLEFSMARWVAARVDRVAFGTEGSERLYRALLGKELQGATKVVLPALPERCHCGQPRLKDPEQVVFVGAFHLRKGLPQLMQAWSQVVHERPSARLTLIGMGSLESTVRALADTLSGVCVILDPPREEIHRILLGASVVVLLSQRTATWREQVGLPIVEGLAHGCSVITTSETGLANWLATHGHAVLSPDATPGEIAEKISRTLAQQRSAESVLADLPDVDGRLAADVWLFAGDDEA